MSARLNLAAMGIFARSCAKASTPARSSLLATFSRPTIKRVTDGARPCGGQRFLTGSTGPAGRISAGNSARTSLAAGTKGREGRQGGQRHQQQHRYGPLTSLVISSLSAVTAAAVWVAPDTAKAGAHPVLATEPVFVPADVEGLSPEAVSWFRRVLRPELMTLGGALGACTGFLTKKIGKTVMFFVGAAFILLQALSHGGYINVNWANVQSSFSQKLQADAQGRVAPGKVTSAFKRWLRWLTSDVPFAGGFIAGFWVGFRFG
ncbi:hypothetical protein HKX48_000456 [Thoreauomyces humboldtii]|nr:hypothetical protein HKX48_000456 [Thoreauomyces humboldtii]